MRAADFWVFFGDVEMSENKNESGDKRARVTDEQFVEVWTEAALSEGTVSDVAEKLGLKKESVSVRATTLRKALREQANVELPKMQRRSRGSQKDFGRLAEIIQQKQNAMEAIAAADEADAEA
jgi:vacuolar-type H+-ATPase subunit I/STV1